MIEYKLFIQMSERNWKEEFERYTTAHAIDSDSLLERFNYRSDLSCKIGKDFPQYQRKSYLIMLVSLFEDFLNQLCRSIEFHQKLNIGFNDLSRSGVERAKTYLTKLSTLSFPSSGKEWKKIKDAQAIRNIIAHAAGHLDEQNHKNQLKIVNSNETLDAESYARTHLNIESEYIIEVADAMLTFSGKLFKECEKNA